LPSFQINLLVCNIFQFYPFITRRVTCAHVYNEIPDSEKDSIFAGVSEISEKKIKKFSFLDLKFVRKNDARDVALFEFTDKSKLQDYGVEEAIFADEGEIDKLKVGKKVYFAGYPLANDFLQMGMGITLAVSETIISSVKYSNRDQKIDFILIDRLVNPGNSGSPVFSEKGKIIGLTSGTLNRTQRIGESLINVPVNIGMVRPSSNYILDLLKEVEDEE